jgi:hypothetical protein
VHVPATLSGSAGGGSTADQTRLKRHAQAALWPQVLQRLEQFVAELSQV